MTFSEEQIKGGQAAYEAYCAETGGKSLITGEQLPMFDNLRPSIRNAWIGVYVAIVNQLKAEPA